jgi:hypothetical protein
MVTQKRDPVTYISALLMALNTWIGMTLLVTIVNLLDTPMEEECATVYMGVAASALYTAR